MLQNVIALHVHSQRTGKWYSVKRFSEFDVDIDLDTDADAFDFVLKNPKGQYTGLFRKFDDCIIWVNDNRVLVGMIDRVEYIEDLENRCIQISGRDLCWRFVDNDALPDTMQNVDPKSYIARIAHDYGVNYVGQDAEIYDKLVVGCGESFISIFNNILLESKQRLWYLVDTLYSGDWNTGGSVEYTFTRSSIVNGIPIKQLNFVEDGTDMKSCIMVYKSNSEENTLMEEAHNEYMEAMNINKRKIRRSYSDSASSRYQSVADKDIRDTFADNIILKISVRMDGEHFYLPNRVARVVYDPLGIDSTFFIKAVKYSKTVSKGSEVILTMIPSDPTFEKTWTISKDADIVPLSANTSEII